MSYFFKYNFFEQIKFKDFKRSLMPGCKEIFLCDVGDILKVFFFIKGSAFFFEGLCLSVTMKRFIMPYVSLLVVNTVQNCTVYCMFSFFSNLIFKMLFNDYKKKKLFF